MKHKNSLPVTRELIAHRKRLALEDDYPTPKWITFSETLMDEGFNVAVYYARQTVSKYLTVTQPGSKRSFLVRFSNHKPNRERESLKDCDFFVGVTHFGVTRTEDALAAVRQHFDTA